MARVRWVERRAAGAGARARGPGIIRGSLPRAYGLAPLYFHRVPGPEGSRGEETRTGRHGNPEGDSPVARARNPHHRVGTRLGAHSPCYAMFSPKPVRRRRRCRRRRARGRSTLPWQNAATNQTRR